jgi:hypothetical protein
LHAEEEEEEEKGKEQTRSLCHNSLFPTDYIIFLLSRNNSSGRGTLMLCGKGTERGGLYDRREKYYYHALLLT